jgi:tetratricopeptide (TPR) repeat protein
LWKDSATKNPLSPRPHNNAGKAYYEKGDLARASYHFEKSVENIPEFVINQYNIQNPESFLIRRSEISGRSGKSESNSPDSLRIMAELVEPHYNLASVYLDQGRLDKAEKEYLKTQALRPSHFSSKIGLSSVYNQKGLYDQAISLLERATQENISSSDPGIALARLNLGELYAKTGKIENAIIEWKAALKIDSSLLPAHFNLGTAYIMTGNLALAENAFKHCLKLNSRYEPALFNLAKFYQMQKKWDESSQQFYLYLEVTGPNSSAYAQIGFNFNRQSDWNNAQKFLEKSISLQPDNVDTRIYLAETLGRLGKIKKAREQLQTALNPNPAQSAAINKMMLSFNSPKNKIP